VSAFAMLQLVKSFKSLLLNELLTYWPVNACFVLKSRFIQFLPLWPIFNKGTKPTRCSLFLFTFQSLSGEVAVYCRSSWVPNSWM